MKSCAIDVKEYTFRYSGMEKDVLKHCNLRLNYGEFTVLSGYSGAGKSTLLASLIGSIPHILSGEGSGEIYVDGQDIKEMRISQIARLIGSVLQNADSQIVHARVEDEIAFGCENLCVDAKEIDRRIEQACEMMQLDRRWQTKKLSGGQKQRLITATTLAMGQKILVLDEPLANLDLEGAHLLMGLLRDLAKNKGYAVLFVEHRLDMVLPYADRLYWMEQGQVEEVEHFLDSYKKHMDIVPDTGYCSYQEDPCFVVDQISFEAAGREILKEVTFEVKKGERVVILGENGCGKTTLMRIMARLLTPSAGTVHQFVDSRIKRKTSPKWFKKVGFVYQNPSFQLFMPQVREEIGYQSQDEENTNRFLALFGLDDLADRHSQSLSEGQKRKLSIAAIAAQRPEVLMLDEPTVGQDYEGLKRVIGTLNSLHKEYKTTMITVTHDFRCAAAIADKVVWMQAGEIYKIGGKELIEQYFYRNLSEEERAI